MKIPILFAASLALVIMAVLFESKGKEPDLKPPEIGGLGLTAGRELG